jgi:hypothetical protein
MFARGGGVIRQQVSSPRVVWRQVSGRRGAQMGIVCPAAQTLWIVPISLVNPRLGVGRGFVLERLLGAGESSASKSVAPESSGSESVAAEGRRWGSSAQLHKPLVVPGVVGRGFVLASASMKSMKRGDEARICADDGG